MAIKHQWSNRYDAPIPSGTVITQERPGEKIARAITEIQGVIDSLLGQDDKGNAVTTRSDVKDIVNEWITRSEALELIQEEISKLKEFLAEVYGEDAKPDELSAQTVTVCVNGVERQMIIYGAKLL